MTIYSQSKFRFSRKLLLAANFPPNNQKCAAPPSSPTHFSIYFLLHKDTSLSLWNKLSNSRNSHLMHCGDESQPSPFPRSFLTVVPPFTQLYSQSSPIYFNLVLFFFAPTSETVTVTYPTCAEHQTPVEYRSEMLIAQYSNNHYIAVAKTYGDTMC